MAGYLQGVSRPMRPALQTRTPFVSMIYLIAHVYISFESGFTSLTVDTNMRALQAQEDC
jgi:hypothetical protein